MTEPSRYPAQVFWSDEDQGWIALAPDLPGCSAFGESQTEALAELQDAIVAWTGAAKEAGNPIPEPSKTAAQAKHSGKLLVRMPKTLHQQLAAQAEVEQVSLNQYIVYLLTRKNAERSASEGLVVTGISTGFNRVFDTQAEAIIEARHQGHEILSALVKIFETGSSSSRLFGPMQTLVPLHKHSGYVVTG